MAYRNTLANSRPMFTPDYFEPERIQLATEELPLRLLQQTDSDKLSDYFSQLSAATRQYFAPHPFDQATVASICATLNPAEIVRLVVTDANDERILAYTLLLNGTVPSDTRRLEALGIDLDPSTDCSLAPSIADAYQSQGVGKFIMEKALSIAQATGKQRIILWGGVQAANQRAVNYYQKYGFVTINEFERNGLKYDMWRTL